VQPDSRCVLIDWVEKYEVDCLLLIVRPFFFVWYNLDINYE